MNQFNALHGDEPTDPPIECNSQPPEAHFNYRNYTTKNRTVVSAIKGIINNQAIYNGDIEVHP